MALPKFFSKITKKTSPQEQNYLSLTLTPNKIIATVWTFQNDKVEITGNCEKTFNDKSAIIHEAAVAIDKAAQNTIGDVDKVVFGLSANWLENGQLSQSTAKLLKELAKDLDLDPQAFIPLASATDHFLKTEMPRVTEVIQVGLFSDYSELHLFRNHKLQKTKTFSSRLDTKDFDEAINTLKDGGESVPNTIILFGTDFHSLASKLEKKEHGAQKNIHIETLSEERLVKAVCLAQAADILGHEPQEISTQASKSTLSSEAKSEAETETETSNDENLGFIANQDLLQNEEPDQELTDKEKQEELNEEYQSAAEIENVAEPLPERLPQQTIRAVDNQPDEEGPQKSKNFVASLFSLNWLFTLINKAPSPKVIVIVLIAILLLAAAAAFAAKETLTNVVVTVKVNGKELEKDFQIEASVSQATADTLKAELLATTAEDSAKTIATGKKKIGQFAKGDVIVFNWTTSPIALQKDTALITKSGVKFKLDSDITVASRSASTPGQAQTQLIAADFGNNGNIPAGNDFTFQTYDELLYSARNDTTFSGGDEKEITVASQEDLDKLEKNLSDTLTQKAKEDLKSKSENRVIYDDAQTIKVIRKEFNKKAGEETNAVNLRLGIEASALVYNEADLKNLLAQKFADQTEQGYELKGENINLEETSVKRQKDKLTITGHLKARLVPKINEDDFASKIAGKSTKQAREIIKQIPDVSDISFAFSPNIPLLVSLPTNKTKIKFKLEAI